MHHHIYVEVLVGTGFAGSIGVFLGLAAIVWILALDQVFLNFRVLLISQAKRPSPLPSFWF